MVTGKLCRGKRMSEKVSEKMSEKMSEKDAARLKIIIDYLEKAESITSSKAADLVDVEIKTANRLLVKAVEQGFLESQGDTKARTYSLKKNGENK